MTPVLHLTLLVFALVCAILAAVGVSAPRTQFGWAAIAFLIASMLSW